MQENNEQRNMVSRYLSFCHFHRAQLPTITYCVRVATVRI